jgi:hypothetical protein
VLTPGRDDASGARADTRKNDHRLAADPWGNPPPGALCGLNREDEARPAGVARVRLAIGDELAMLLLSSLAGDHRRSLLRVV